jgi:acetyl esterase/lipase
MRGEFDAEPAVGSDGEVDRKLRAAGADARNRQARGDRRRQQILDAAVELFALRGYQNTGILTLADRVGLSDTGLLYYFGSKERLLHEVVAERPQVRFPVPAEQLTLRQLRDLGRRYADERMLTRLYIVLAAESLSEEDPLHEFFVHRYGRGVEFIRAVLEHDREGGAIRSDVDTNQIAAEILATELGLELMWLMDPAIDIASIRASQIDHLVEDLAPQSRRERHLPAPASLSGEARAALASGPLFPIAYPDDSDSEGWRRFVAERDALALPPLAGWAAALPAEVEPLDLQGVTVYSITPANISEGDDRVLLELHPGGFVEGGGPRCRAAGVIAASRIGMRLWAVDYRMPPAHPYPAALDDTLTAYRGLLNQVDADRIVLHGPQAGGNLAAALVLRARDEGLPLPGAVVLLSPQVDLTESGDSFQANLGIDTVLTTSLMPANRLYANGVELAHPYVSPLFGDFTRGFPPAFLASGTRDLLLSGAVRMHQRLRAADIPADLYVLEAAPHGGFFGSAPEDHELNRQVCRFIDEHVPPRAAMRSTSSTSRSRAQPRRSRTPKPKR